MAGITWEWGGTAVATTRSSGAVWTVRDWEIGPLVHRPRVQRMELHTGELETFDPLPEFSRSWRLVVEIDASGVTGTSPTGLSRLLDAWREAAAFWSPLDGATALTATSEDSDGGTPARQLFCNVLSTPEFRMQTGDPQGLSRAGAYDVNGKPYIIWVAEGDTRFPYWVNETLLDQDTSPADAELAVSMASDTVTVHNPFDRWVGVKFVVKNGSVSGSVATVTITNNTNGSKLKFSDDGGSMDNDEYIDWYASDPLAHARSADWSFGAGPNNLRLDPGDNVLESISTGGGSLTLSVLWPELTYTM